MINVLSETQIEQAISGLKANFLDPSKTDDKELRRATLEGIVRRLSPGAALVMESDIAAKPAAGPFVAEILDARIGYLRPGAIDPETLAQTDAALKSFSEKKLKALILDLRNVPASRDFESAADLARRFCEKGKLLFSIQKPSAKQERIFTSNMDPVFSGVLVVLTDADTSGSAEVVAGVLRRHANAMIVGATTSGEAVEFDDMKLGDGKVLRVAVSKVVLAEDGAIYPGGVTPDIAAALPPKSQEQIFRTSAEKGVGPFVFETERPRMNEAALVANTNPEIDVEPADTVQPGARVWDSVLQRAVDLVTAIGLYGRKP
jgi:C-terminal processing protease CtpA/Prc